MKYPFCRNWALGDACGPRPFSRCITPLSLHETEILHETHCRRDIGE